MLLIFLCQLINNRISQIAGLTGYEKEQAPLKGSPRRLLFKKYKKINDPAVGSGVWIYSLRGL